MEVDKINKLLLTKTLNFHGIQLQKIFETEYQNFSTLKLDSSLHFNEYAARQKQLSFQDRGKRFRLQQFICKHANKIFSKHVKPICEDPCKSRTLDTGYFPILPPYESFLSVDKEHRIHRFFEYIKQGDLIATTLMSKTAAGMILKVLFGECDEIRCVPDVGIKAFCPTSSLIAAVDKKTNTSRAFLINDLVCCEILEVSVDTGKITCGMKGVYCRPENQPRLGLMHSDNFPIEYRIYQEKKDKTSYNALLEKSESFQNPNLINNLMMHLGLPNEFYTHINYLKEKFPSKDCAVELRIAQAAKWAIQSVTDGIEHFKCGRFSEAYQCLNKALTIDPRNVEALVARGALYANSSNYEKAIIDFENALKFNPNHQNAKKYLGDTLVAYGITFEETGKFTEAVNAYETCLLIIPNHEEASNSLQFIKNKMQSTIQNCKKENEEVFPNASKIEDINNTLTQLLSVPDDTLQVIPEVKKQKNKKRSSSTSSSSSSSDSTSDFSSSSSSSSSSLRSKKKKNRKSKKGPSLSPLSQRIFQLEGPKLGNQFNPVVVSRYSNSNSFSYAPMSTGASSSGFQTSGVDNENEYELRVRKFLKETKKDEDYEDKVRKFLDETAKWKKKQKSKEEKSRRKKKEKKLKAKRKKKEKKKKKRKHRSGSVIEDDLLLAESTLGLSSLTDLEKLQRKISAYYSKVAKNIIESARKEVRQTDGSGTEEDIETEIIEKSRRLVENKQLETYSDEDHIIANVKPESNTLKFKILNTVANKIKRRSSEDPLWGDDKVLSELAPAEDSRKSKLKPSLDREKYHHIERPQLTDPMPSINRSNSPPVFDKLGTFLIKKMPSISPKREIHPQRKSFSRSRSKTMDSPRKSTRYDHSPHSVSRRRYSRSRSRSNSYQKHKYTRYTRSRSYSRSRSRSPYSRNRSYYSRNRTGGTYYKPKVQNYRGVYRGKNWKNNNYDRGFYPRFRGSRRSHKGFKNRYNRRSGLDRAPSDDEFWDSSFNDGIPRNSGSDDNNRDTSYEEYCDDYDSLVDKSDRNDRPKSTDHLTD